MPCAVISGFCAEVDNQLQIGSICKQACKIVKNEWALDLTFSVISDTLKMIDLHAKVEAVARPALGIMATTCGVISTISIFKSIHYFQSDDFKKHCEEVTIAALVTECSMCLGRTLAVIHFVEKLGFFSFDELAKMAYQIGGVSISALAATQVMHGAFIVGLAGLVFQNIEGIRKGENIASNSFAIISYTTDIAIIALGLVQATNPFMIGALGIVACGTGLISYLTKDNKEPLEPIKSGITWVTSQLPKNVGELRSISGSIAAGVGLVSLWIAVSEPFENLGLTFEKANKGLGFLHVFQTLGDLAESKVNDSCIYVSGKVMITFKNIIGFVQFLEQLAVISIDTGQSCLVKTVSSGFDIAGNSLILIHHCVDLKEAIDRDGFEEALTLKRKLDISISVIKLAAIGLTFAGTGFWIKNAKYVAQLGICGIHIGSSLHKYLATSTG